MSWLQALVMSATGIAAMHAAFERGDVDEAARKGGIAGPAAVERALGAADRVTRLAAIAAAPIIEDRAELLEALARVAGGADRRTAIPAAGAARAIARELASHDRPDDLAEDDLARWRGAWAALAMRGDRWIELRVLALETAAALDHAGIGVDLAAALRDPDPAFRRAAATIVPLPAPVTSYAALAGAVGDGDPDVALGAAQSLCLSIDPTREYSRPRDSASLIDPTGEYPRPAGHAVGVPSPRNSASLIDLDPAASPRPILDALGAAGVTRLRALVISDRPSTAAAVRDIARCLAAERSP